MIARKSNHGQMKSYPDSKVHGANMGPTWVLWAPDGPMLAPGTLLSGLSYLDIAGGELWVSNGHELKEIGRGMIDGKCMARNRISYMLLTKEYNIQFDLFTHCSFLYAAISLCIENGIYTATICDKIFGRSLHNFKISMFSSMKYAKHANTSDKISEYHTSGYYYGAEMLIAYRLWIFLKLLSVLYVSYFSKKS